jgi:hypothetical protein
MASRFKKPRDPQETVERGRFAGRVLATRQPIQQEQKPVDEEYKLTIKDYIKYSPAIAKELGKESPKILAEMINPVGSVSAEKLAGAIAPEISQAMTGKGLQPQKVGSLQMNPKLASLARMMPGVTSALTDSNLGSMFSADTANKALQNALGMSKKGITKGDLVWLGLMYGQPVRGTKKLFKAASKLIP